MKPSLDRVSAAYQNLRETSVTNSAFRTGGWGIAKRCPSDLLRAFAVHNPGRRHASQSADIGSILKSPGSPSSYHDALDHLQSVAFSTNPCRTGFMWM